MIESYELILRHLYADELREIKENLLKMKPKGYKDAVCIINDELLRRRSLASS